jgi:hypothetical protein
MNPVDFPQSNRVFTKPAGMTDEECAPLRVHDTGEALISCWQLTQAEVEVLQRTGRVWLWVHGRGHPPVNVEVEDPWTTAPSDEPEPERSPLERCPATPDGRLPPDEISDCEFCGGTAYCSGLVDAMPPDLEPRVCLRVTVDGDDDESLCSERHGDRQDDPARVTCERCRALLSTAPPALPVEPPA